MATGQNPPFQQYGSYYFATGVASSTNAFVAGGADTAVITNVSTANLYVSFGSGTAPTAVVGTGYAIPAGQQRTIALPPTAIWIAGILDASTTGHLYLEIGTGSAR